MQNWNIFFNHVVLGGFVFISILTGCESYFDVEVDKAQVISDRVFQTEGNARAAVNGIYQAMVTSAFGGGSSGIAALSGLSSDELVNPSLQNSYLAFQQSNLSSDDPYISNLWRDSYAMVYQTNDIIERLDESAILGEDLKNQLKGECLFIRGVIYFYLYNLFGDVPLILTTDYRVNSTARRVDTASVISQIESDLILAQTILGDEYTGLRRSRPNSFAAAALLSRLYLYKQDWEAAESLATKVIECELYPFSTSIDGLFEMSSEETVWQLASEQNYNTKDAAAFISDTGVGNDKHVLSESLLKSFEEGDLRWEVWVGRYLNETSGVDISYPYKYKARLNGATKEYYIFFRLAEQFLIRAEARIHLGKVSSAVEDLDRIRVRAGLSPVSRETLSQDTLIQIVEHERRIELFSEFGHRWFDLKRTGRAAEQLSKLKSGWTEDDVLYPIPFDEFLKNPMLGLQNSGY